MPNRIQVLRSSAPGVLPANGTRQPGELWLNFADWAFGFIDTAQTAQKLLAVRWFVPTANYATGDFVLQGGNLYRAIAPSASGSFVAANWSKVGTAADLTAMQAYVDAGDAARLPLAGGTLTGPLVLAADPSAAAQAATKRYVDAGDAANAAATALMLPLAGGTLTGALNGVTANFSGVATAADPPASDSSDKLVTTAWFGSHLPATKENSNRIINGDMRIDQRNNGASGTATSVYTIDRWLYGATQAAKGTWQRVAAGPALQSLGFGYWLNFVSSSAYAVLAGDSFNFRQPIEADMVADFAWGTSGAQPITLSFVVSSTLAGTFGGAISNAVPGTRSYPFSYSIPVASAWTKIAVTIPGDIGGTWTLSGNGVGAVVWFDLGSGATFRAPAGAWASGDFRGANGAISVVGTNAVTFSLTGVKFEIGSIATPFNRQTTAKSVADCQRYYSVFGAGVTWSGNATSGAAYIAWAQFNQTMRTTPTVTMTDQGSSGFPTGSPTLAIAGSSGLRAQKTCNATTTGGYFVFSYVADAEL